MGDEEKGTVEEAPVFALGPSLHGAGVVGVSTDSVLALCTTADPSQRLFGGILQAILQFVPMGVLQRLAVKGSLPMARPLCVMLAGGSPPCIKKLVEAMAGNACGRGCVLFCQCGWLAPAPCGWFEMGCYTTT